MGGAKTARLNIRLTADELVAIKSRARKSGIGISEYVRCRCLRSINRPAIIADAETLKAMYANLRHCGGNLNQCASAINRHAQISDDELASAFRAVASASTDISRFIADIRKNI